MLPWNPPSSFSSAGDANQQNIYRSPYSLDQSQQQQQQQQQQHQQQQQQQPQPQAQQQQQAAAAATSGAPPAYPPMTLASTLHFLQSEHRRYARDRNEWEIERAEMRARIALLEGEKRGNEGALRDLNRRCKMLENALRGERSKFLSTTNALAAGHTPSPSGTSSPIQIAPSAAGPSGIPPGKAAQLLSNLNPHKSEKDTSTKDASSTAPTSLAPPESAAMAPSTSSPGIASGTPAVTVQAAPGVQSRAGSSLGLNGATLNGIGGGTWGTAGTTSGATLGVGRDPRGKARSRDYLKQCLQEITYLTSTTTLNPLSATSYGAPSVARPRKTLPDQVPGTTSSSIPPPPGVFNLTSIPQSGLNVSAPAPPPPTAAPPALAGAFELPPSVSDYNTASQSKPPPASRPQQQHPITQFPSDPASVFVPLKRTVSQPGVSSERDLPKLNEKTEEMLKEETSETVEEDPFEPSVEEKKAQEVEEKKEEEEKSVERESTTESDESNESNTSSEFPQLARVNRRHDDSYRGAVINGVNGGGHDEVEVGGEGGAEGGANRLTAIFRPESDEEWQERLKEAGKGAYSASDEEKKKGLGIEAKEGEEGELDEELAGLQLDVGGEEKEKEQQGGGKTEELWEVKKTLRAHLDSVRAFVFLPTKGVEDPQPAHRISLATAGDDYTIKVWRDVSLRGSSSSSDLEPSHTHRGHLQPITSLIFLPSSQTIYSSSLDGTIRLWKVPPHGADPYAPVDSSLLGETLMTFEEAVWGLAFVEKTEELVCICADGTVGVLDLKSGKEQRSWLYAEEEDGEGYAPTAVVAIPEETRVAVAGQDALVKVFEVSTGELKLTIKADETSDGTPKTQINALAVHPSLPVLATGHEDRFIRLFSLEDGSQTHSILAHLDGVTSLTFHPSLSLLASVSHDSSLRLWSSDLSCIQEVSTHRSKLAEGVLAVGFHPVKNWLATAGADGVVKLWGRGGGR